MPEDSLQVRWRLVAYGSLTLSAALLVTLAVVVSLDDVDTLAAVALTLAILSFVVQMMIAASDMVAAGRLDREIIRINADSRSALAEIRTAANDVMGLLRTQFDTVLQAALGDVVSEADSPEEVRAVQELGEALRERVGNDYSVIDTALDSRRERTEARRKQAMAKHLDEFWAWAERNRLQRISEVEYPSGPIVLLSADGLMVAASPRTGVDRARWRSELNQYADKHDSASPDKIARRILVMSQAPVASFVEKCNSEGIEIETIESLATES